KQEKMQIKDVIYKIWQEMLKNGQQKPVRFPAILVLPEEVLHTAAPPIRLLTGTALSLQTSSTTLHSEAHFV
ncbi:MAG: hypothetical protein ACI4UU_04590, partial [Clostridia bacterium]